MKERYMSAFIKCELFEGIEKTEIKSLLKCLSPNIQTYERSDFVVRPGDTLNSIGIVIEGEASVFKESLSGNRLLMKNLSAGEMFGEIAAFARKKEWPALVQANTPLTVCFIPQNKIVGDCGHLCAWHSTMINNMLRLVSERAIMLSKKMEYISIKTMRAKLCTYIYEQYMQKGATTLMLPMNRNQLADFLNVSRPSMSRELSRMKDEGIIDYHLSTVKILKLDSLRAFCE